MAFRARQMLDLKYPSVPSHCLRNKAPRKINTVGGVSALTKIRNEARAAIIKEV